MKIRYIRLINDNPLPTLTDLSPFKALVIIEDAVRPTWQSKVSAWLANSGCLYMLAWGEGCSSWDDSVDMANIDQFPSGEIPDDKTIMTTWHDAEPLEDMFHFAKYEAKHSTEELVNTVMLHISGVSKEVEFKRLFEGVSP